MSSLVRSINVLVVPPQYHFRSLLSETLSSRDDLPLGSERIPEPETGRAKYYAGSTFSAPPTPGATSMLVEWTPEQLPLRTPGWHMSACVEFHAVINIDITSRNGGCRGVNTV